jgi:SpoVK/Ycf46/Vps4 family AAA+-type ATPase
MSKDNWIEANQHYLLAALSPVRNALKRFIEPMQSDAEAEKQEGASQEVLEEALSAMPAPPALANLCAAIGLSPFERDILLLCAGMDLDSAFAALCAKALYQQWNERNVTVLYPTFSLALAALPHPHWDALTASAPLRRWRLITLGSSHPLTLSPLHIDEYILHYLVGISQPDERLAGIISLLSAPTHLVSSHRLLAERFVAVWSQAVVLAGSLPLPQWGTSCRIPIVHLSGEDSLSMADIAATACQTLGLNLYKIRIDDLHTKASDIDILIRLWEREAVLSKNALLLDCDDLDSSDAAKMSIVTRIMQQMNGPLIVATSERCRLPRRRTRPMLVSNVHKPGANEQHVIWQDALASVDLNGHIDLLVSQFNLSASAIHSISAKVLNTSKETPSLAGDQANLAGDAREDLSKLLWDACRVEARPGLDDLAQRIESAAVWDDLVLPEAQRQLLHEIAAHVRHRTTVYETWGFISRGARGLGISALFAGASGTGKTLAAEVLAHELRLDLYRIDLSSVVSKYIGETEKNLRRVFDAAEEGGAILLFDEADALFGKRSEVKDSHDRYANIEVSYLLQRMEVYRGLAILTTNLKNALDTAFLRRIRFVVQFPFPDAMQRAEIWRRILPERLPIENLDVGKLARLNVTGGNIRNIALNAAFLAADTHEPVRMAHMLRAAYTEYAKLEKPLTEAEIGGWL